jgi:hypothetical protein
LLKERVGAYFFTILARLAEEQIEQSDIMHRWGQTLGMRSSGRLIMIYFLGPAIHLFMLHP